MSFFDDDDDEDDFNSLSSNNPRPGPNPISYGQSGSGSNRASSSREGSVSGSSSFLDRLRSTVSPPPGGQQQQQQQQQQQSRSRASESIYAESLSYNNHRGESSSILGSIQGDDHDIDINEDDDPEDLDLDDENLNDIKKLSKYWVKERGTVDLNPWQGDLIDQIFDKLEQQQKMVNTLRSDPQTSEEEHFKLMLVQTEMERVKYLVRSYVRTRLHKIEKFAHYITITPDMHHLLSGAELSHARRYTELLHTHFQHSVLDSLPEWLRKMDDTYGDGLSMVTKPNRNIPVLIYCRKDCGEITLEGGERAALAKGTTHLVKYRLVDRWINLGWAEVL